MDGVVLRVLSPPEPLLTGVRSPENANNVVLRLSSGDLRVLLTGDIEAETECYLAGTGDDPRADVLKLPHHGVSTSTTPALLDAVRPRYAVISCAVYAEPSRTLYDRFDRRGITWYRTDANGTVVFRYDGKRLAVETERGEPDARLKVAPDWYQTLKQVEAIPAKARRTWTETIRPEARRAWTEEVLPSVRRTWVEEVRPRARRWSERVRTTVRIEGRSLPEDWRRLVRKLREDTEDGER